MFYFVTWLTFVKTITLQCWFFYFYLYFSWLDVALIAHATNHLETEQQVYRTDTYTHTYMQDTKNLSNERVYTTSSCSFISTFAFVCKFETDDLEAQRLMSDDDSVIRFFSFFLKDNTFDLTSIFEMLKQEVSANRTYMFYIHFQL